MTKHGEFRIAQQSGNVGCFGEVKLEVEIVEDGFAFELDEVGLHVSIPTDLDYRDGVRFGIAYAYEKSRVARGIKVVRVKVVDIHGHTVDSTQAVMAFVAANAFWSALDETPTHPPTLNAGLVIFPK